MTDTKHTPAPWPKEIIEKIWIAGINKLFADGELGTEAVAAIIDKLAHADASHIVKCVNMHDELVEALLEVMRKTNDIKASVIASDALKKAGAL